MVILKTPEEIEKMRISGNILARVLRTLKEAIEVDVTTTGHLDKIAFDMISEAGAVPSFLNYNGFPASACISVNEEVVHGIPGVRILRSGDIVGIDIGVCKDGWHADSAITVPVGEIKPEVKRLLAVTKESLNQGIAKAKIGNKIGDIAATIQQYIESNGFGVVRDLVGHGLGQNLHEGPSVPNFGKAKSGPVLREGMTIAIEPMVNLGTWKVRTLSDHWTIVSADGKPSAHFEHTIAITKSGPDILTLETA